MLGPAVGFVQWIELDDELSNDDRFEPYDPSADAVCGQPEGRDGPIGQCHGLVDKSMRILV